MQGYIYVLINPSMNGVVKVGLTARDPEDRVSELSSATGVPTPFILVYKEYVSDCQLVEKAIHGLLDARGFRVNSNREFFNAPVHEVLSIIQEVKKKTFVFEKGLESNNDSMNNRLEGEEENNLSLVESIFEEGISAFYGTEIIMQDYIKALKCFEITSKAGMAEAFYYKGIIYQNGYGVKEDINHAIEILKEGMNRGSASCSATLGILYSSGMNPHHDNSRICWKRFFELVSIKNISGDMHFIIDYLHYFLTNGWEIEHMNSIEPFIDSLIELCQDKIVEYSQNDSPLLSTYVRLKHFLTTRRNGNINENESIENADADIISINYDGISPVFIIKVASGSFAIGDKVEVITRAKEKVATIIKIVSDKSVGNAIEGETIEIVLDGMSDDYLFAKGKEAYIVKSH